MFSFNKKFLLGLLFCFILGSVQSAYSSSDEFHGRVKYGSYHCVKDGNTCDYDRYENGSKMIGLACPRGTNMNTEESNRRLADFLNSSFCQFTPSIKKYKCKYADGTARVYLKNGKVITASHTPDMKRNSIQDFYDPNSCVEETMTGDFGDYPSRENVNKNSFNISPKNTNTASGNFFDDSTEGTSIRSTVHSFIKAETDPINDEINSLKNQINILNDKINTYEKYFLYLAVLAGVTLVLLIIALVKSNNDNPYHRL